MTEMGLRKKTQEDILKEKEELINFTEISNTFEFTPKYNKPPAKTTIQSIEIEQTDKKQSDDDTEIVDVKTENKDIQKNNNGNKKLKFIKFILLMEIIIENNNSIIYKQEKYKKIDNDLYENKDGLIFFDRQEKKFRLYISS